MQLPLGVRGEAGQLVAVLVKVVSVRGEGCVRMETPAAGLAFKQNSATPTYCAHQDVSYDCVYTMHDVILKLKLKQLLNPTESQAR